MGHEEYAYLAFDVKTLKVLDELPLYGVWLSRQVSQTAEWTGTLRLNTDVVTNKDAVALTEPGLMGILVLRNGQLIYTGITWTRTYSSDVDSLQLNGQTLESYLYKRYITQKIAFTQIDQYEIVRGLFRQMIADPDSALRTTDLGSNLSGVKRDRTYGLEEIKPYGEAVEELSKVENGFDWFLDSQWGPGDSEIAIQLVQRAPGGPSPTDLVLELPGNIQSLSQTDAASTSGIKTWAIGAEGKRAYAIDSRYTDGGYPLLEYSQTYSDVSVQATLQAHANEDLRKNLPPNRRLILTLQTETYPQVGDFALGQWTNFTVLRDEIARWPDGVEWPARIIGFEVTPPSKDGEEKLKLDVEVLNEG